MRINVQELACLGIENDLVVGVREIQRREVLSSSLQLQTSLRDVEAGTGQC